MSDTTPRNPVSAPQMMADALLRSMTGTTALLRVTNASADTNQTELGIVSTAFVDVSVGPVVMRKLRPTLPEGNEPKWELLVSTTGVERQANALDLSSAESLFALTMAIIVAGQEYLIESITSNEAFGQVYLYRLLLRAANPKSI